jgi:SET domain-containing protein
MTEIPAALGYIKDTGTEKGRGVFAKRKIAEGEIVEVSRVIVIRTPLNQLPSHLHHVIFNWGSLTKQETPSSCMALGMGSMYNHATPANVRYIPVPEESLMKFVAARDIEAEEELTINYNQVGGDVSYSDDSWFKNRGMTPLS